MELSNQDAVMFIMRIAFGYDMLARLAERRTLAAHLIGPMKTADRANGGV